MTMYGKYPGGVTIPTYISFGSGTTSDYLFTYYQQFFSRHNFNSLYPTLNIAFILMAAAVVLAFVFIFLSLGNYRRPRAFTLLSLVPWAMIVVGFFMAYSILLDNRDYNDNTLFVLILMIMPLFFGIWTLMTYVKQMTFEPRPVPEEPTKGFTQLQNGL